MQGSWLQLSPVELHCRSTSIKKSICILSSIHVSSLSIFTFVCMFNSLSECVRPKDDTDGFSLILSRAWTDFLDLDGRTAWHFPYVGYARNVVQTCTNSLDVQVTKNIFSTRLARLTQGISISLKKISAAQTTISIITTDAFEKSSSNWRMISGVSRSGVRGRIWDFR